MFDHHAMLATLLVATVVLTSATLVLSRIIPDDYDRRVPVRRRIDAGKPPRKR